MGVGSGLVKHVHANKMRKFNVRVHGLNVISEMDDQFGRVLAPDSNVLQSVMLPNSTVDKSKLSHLSDEQQSDILVVLDQFAACFSDKPGLCNVTMHQIHVTTGFQPKRMRPYRVSEVMKSKVERWWGAFSLRFPSRGSILVALSLRFEITCRVRAIYVYIQLCCYKPMRVYLYQY